MYDFDSFLVIWKQKNVNFENSAEPRKTWYMPYVTCGQGLSEKYKHNTWNSAGTEIIWPLKLAIGFYNIDLNYNYAIIMCFVL